MDELEKAQADLKAANDKVAALEAEKVNLAKEKETLEADLADKEKHLVEKTGQMKKLRDMTDAERAKLSANEIALKQEQERIDAQNADILARQADMDAREMASRKAAVFQKLAGNNPDNIAKLEGAYGEIVGDAKTEAEITAKAEKAFNMSGLNVLTNPLIAAQSMQGDTPRIDPTQNSFADTEKGKVAAQMMGLEVAPVAAKVEPPKQ